MYFSVVFIYMDTMDTKEIYKILSYHHLDPDDEQDIA